MEVNNRINVLKTKNFNKIMIDLVFPSKREDNYAIYGNLLVRMLTKKTNEFSSEENFSNALTKNYVIDFSFSKESCGDNWFYTYHIVLPDNEVLKDNGYKYLKTLEFLKKAIYEPFSLDDSFYDEEVEKAKSALKTHIESGLKNINGYSSMRLDEIMDSEGYFSDAIYNHKDDIDNVNSENLFKYYKDVIKEKSPFIFIAGNVDDEFVKNIENIFIKDLTFSTYIPYKIHPYQIDKDVKIVEEVKDYSQSIVKMAYKVNDYTKEDMVKLSLVTILLNSQSSNILSDYLRTKYNLVYTCGAFAYLNNGVLIITAQISLDKKDKTIEAIKEVINQMKEKEFLEEKLGNVKEKLRINLERQKDSLTSNLDDLQTEFFDSYLTMPKEYEEIKRIKACDIVKFMDRVILDTIYYLEGVKDAK